MAKTRLRRSRLMFSLALFALLIFLLGAARFLELPADKLIAALTGVVIMVAVLIGLALVAVALFRLIARWRDK